METMLFRGPGFEMQVPTNWLIRASPQHQAIFITPQREDNLLANLVVDLVRISSDVGLAEIRILLQRTRQDLFPDAEVLVEDEATLDGRPAYHCFYRFQHPKADKATLQRIIALPVDGMLVSLTASRTAGEAADLDRTLAGMIQDFKFV
ncbi:MAG: hypothetical protein JXB85_01245 [Anaerolineales bacterium]|nr:hypothetical protein [Anaerolineales bacterium]